MRKVVYIIPGFTEKTNLAGYRQVITFFKEKNFKVVPIKITWQRRVMSEYVDEFACQFIHQESDDVYLFGFSFGAIVAFLSAAKLQPNMLFLCSLSPYFKEDLKFLRKSWKQGIGKKRIEDFKKFSFQTLAKDIHCRTILIAGEKEPKELYRRMNDAHKRIKNSEIFVANNAKHEISQKEYIEKLQEVISNL